MATPDRWTPWIEPFVGMSAASQNITSTTFGTVTGCSITVTPDINTRVAVFGSTRCVATTSSDTGGLRFRMQLNGNTIGFWNWGRDKSTTEGRSMSLSTTADLTKETAYTFTLEASTSIVTATFTIFGFGLVGTGDYSTGFSLIAMPRLYAP